MSSWLPTFHDRRSLRRYVRTACQVVTEEAFRLVAERTIDVSAEGMLVESNAELERGTAILFSLLLPGGQTWIDGEGRVSRVLRGLRATDGRRSLGISFERLDAVDRALLRASLRGRPPSLPARPLRMDYVSAIRMIGRDDVDSGTGR